jgi:transketolase
MTAAQARTMRQACSAVMADIAERHPELVALGADGMCVYGEIARRWPARYVDVGIAEANLVGVAAGLARAGKRPFVGSIASFLFRRAYEQIRVDISEPNLPVTLVGVGSGVSYGLLGATHHAPEDIALFRSMPHCTIFSPADLPEAEWALRFAADIEGMTYVRLPAQEEVGVEPIPPIPPGHELGAPRLLRDGSRVAIVATGGMVAHALAAACALHGSGVSPAVIGLPTLRPLDEGALRTLVAPYSRLVSVEDHLVTGGLASLLRDAEIARVPLLALGLPVGSYAIGTREHIHRLNALDRDGIARKVKESTT